MLMPTATPPVQAATITVMNINDSGSGSLRQAIADAASGDTIHFAGNVTGTIVLTSGELAIDKSLTIQGPGTNVLTVSGNNISRVFNIAAGDFNVTFSGLTIANGRAVSNLIAIGGGIYNKSTGTLNILNSKLTGNSAIGTGGGEGSGSWGGGIFNEGATLNITDSTLTGNSAAASGGGLSYVSRGGCIFNAGPVNITRSTLMDNSASASGGNGSRSEGGAIYHVGSSPVSITSSTLSGNSVSATNSQTLNLGGGGVIHCDGSGAVNITNSTFSGNSAFASGDAAANFGHGGVINGEASNTVNITSSTFTGNSASASGSALADNGAEGGAVRNLRGTFEITSSTFTRNSASTSGTNSDNESAGGGIVSAYGLTTIKNTIVAGNSVQRGTNTFGGPDMAGFFTSQGYNLIGNNEVAVGFPAGNPNANNDYVGTNTAPIEPLLGPLQDNGGPTHTHALLANSPAIDRGNSFGLATDQRGVSRPQRAASDIGAFEQTFVTMSPTFGGFIISYQGVPDEIYSLQYSSDLISWHEFTRDVSPVSAGRPRNAPAEFYRAQLVP